MKKDNKGKNKTENSAPLISTHDVHVYYDSFKALDNINMEVEANTVTALIGPSGCGKSTFLRLFNRMNDYIDGFRMEGKIYLDQNNLYSKKIKVEELRKQVGMVFQKPNPFPKSIFENVAYGLKIQGIKNKEFIRERVKKALMQVTLWDEVKDDLNKQAFTLSGGQQQRLCIARTLAVEPSIILMDEPTSALDPISTHKIEELLYDLKEWYTIIIVTHNLQQAGRISDKTAFFYMGQLIEYGNTRDIFSNPREERTENYITGRFG